MNKKSLLGLILFACLITTGLFASANFLINQEGKADADVGQSYSTQEDTTKDTTGVDTSKDESVGDTVVDSTADNTADNTAKNEENGVTNTDTKDVASADEIPIETIVNGEDKKDSNTKVTDSITEEPWLTANPSDTGATNDEIGTKEDDTTKDASNSSEDADDTFSTSIDAITAPELILDCNEVDYKKYIPEMVVDSKLETELDISNPSISVDATAAILFDADTKKVLYYKNPVQAVFPASTAKLLTSLVAMDWCKEDEEVTIGDEITMIASDSTRAYLSKGEVLTIRNILAGMLLPSGNDAAYAMAAYVGRKSLQDPNATKEEAVAEFVKLMNNKAKKLGVKNSCFKTPDGYDAIGQYTTAYDMGLIGIAAAKNETIIDVSHQSSSRNIFVSGEDVTWNNTNKLITRYSGQYYSPAIGLKTGTSTMAGRCLIAAAENDGKEVVCVIMDSSSAGRWEDAIALLKYGLE
ncbi:MAG: putative rane protein [Herbinix sp.]|jgi:D-alanyl-D-alanine carboxypeptidase (penicillin-binding protein 5/6)|nr:putative rane protein [Herbinix sp.]